MRTRQRLASVTVAVIALSVIGIAVASAQVSPDEVVAGLEQGVYVEAGAESVDAAGLAVVRASAAAEDIDLHVVVLAGSLTRKVFR